MNFPTATWVSFGGGLFSKSTHSAELAKIVNLQDAHAGRTVVPTKDGRVISGREMLQGDRRLERVFGTKTFRLRF